MWEAIDKWQAQMAVIILYILTSYSPVDADVTSYSLHLASVTPVLRQTTPLKENAVWMKDPLQVSNRLYYMGYEEFLTRQLYEFKSTDDMTEGTKYADSFHSLPQTVAGTGFIVYDRNLYYNREGTRNLVRFDLTTQSIAAEVQLRNANYDGTSPYAIGLSTDIDFAADENGLWVIYATEKNRGNIVLSKLEPQTLEIVQTWETQYYKLSALNAFIVRGTLYTVNYNSRGIDYMFNTTSNLGEAIEIPFPGISKSAASVNYNPKEEALYVWDRGEALKFLLEFKPIITERPTTIAETSTANPTTTKATTTTPYSTATIADSVPLSIHEDVWTEIRGPATTPSRNDEDDDVLVTAAIAPVPKSKNVLILRIVLGASLGLVIVAGVIILYCVLIPQRTKRNGGCLRRKNRSRRYQYPSEYAGQMHLQDALYAPEMLQDNLNYGRPYSASMGQATTLLPVSEAQAGLFDRRRGGPAAPARSLSEMDVLRAVRINNNEVGNACVQRHHLQENCFCGTHFVTTRCGTMPSKSLKIIQTNPKNILPHRDNDEMTNRRLLYGASSRDARASTMRYNGRPRSEHYQYSHGVLDRGLNVATPLIVSDSQEHDHSRKQMIVQREYVNSDAVDLASRSAGDCRQPSEQDQQFATATSGYSTNLTQSSESPESYDSLPPRRPRIKMGTSDLPLRGTHQGWDNEQARRLHLGHMTKRSSDPLSTDQGYVTDGQNPDGSPEGQNHQGRYQPYRAAPAYCPELLAMPCSAENLHINGRLMSPVLPGNELDSFMVRENDRTSSRVRDSPSPDISDCPSENDREVERIIASTDDHNNCSMECNTTIDHLDISDMIDTAIGGRISDANTVTSWTAHPGSISPPSAYRNPEKIGPSVFRETNQPTYHHTQDESRMLYTLPGTASAKTTAKINLRTGGVSMITNL